MVVLESVLGIVRAQRNQVPSYLSHVPTCRVGSLWDFIVVETQVDEDCLDFQPTLRLFNLEKVLLSTSEIFGKPSRSPSDPCNEARRGIKTLKKHGEGSWLEVQVTLKKNKVSVFELKWSPFLSRTLRSVHVASSARLTNLDSVYMP